MKSNNLIMGVLVAVIAVMGVAFAAFSTSLTIEGTASISSNWKIDYEAGNEGKCTSVFAADKGGQVSFGTISVEEGIVKIDATMISPRDEIACTVKVTNNSTNLDAVRKGWTWATDGSISDPAYSVVLDAPVAAKLEPGDSETLTVKITYNDVTVKPTGKASFTAVATYGQYGISE